MRRVSERRRLGNLLKAELTEMLMWMMLLLLLLLMLVIVLEWRNRTELRGGHDGQKTWPNLLYGVEVEVKSS